MGKPKTKFTSQTMYRVDKFFPQECPKCGRKFNAAGTDYAPVLGKAVKCVQTVKKICGFVIARCASCGNLTPIIPLESRMLHSRAAAKRLLKQGFTNLHEVTAFGNVKEFEKLEEVRKIYGKLPSVEEMIVKK